MNVPFADYEEERRLFEELLDPACRRHILLFQGESGSGKSALLRHCLAQEIPPYIAPAAIQLRGGDTTIGHFFYEMSSRVGWDRLPSFSRSLARLAGVQPADLDPDLPAVISEQLSRAFRAEDPADRAMRQAALTETWFADCRSQARLVLAAVDTYEQATGEFRGWFERQFLMQAAQTEQVRVVLAGQQVPEHRHADWAGCCRLHKLKGVREAGLWLPVAEAMGRQVNEIYLAGACAALKGNPSKILQFIEGLPRRTQPEVSVEAVDRQLLLDLLSERADESDLRKACFRLNIDYDEEFEGKKSDRIMALIVYTERRGRYDELLDVCRRQRPDLFR